jgi:aminoglycoside phosphotransferase (APT) family kinase protein
MNLPPVTLNPEETQAVLGAVLREVHGADARLAAWSAGPVSQHGKHRTLRYDLDARIAGEPELRRYRWVGKFYGRDEDAPKIARGLRELAATDCSARGGLVLPSVVAYHVPRRLLLLTYETGTSVTRAIALQGALVLQAIGRALAALHATPVTLDAHITPATLLGGLRTRITHLCARFPGESDALRTALNKLERQAPSAPAAQSFVHGDLGPSQLLWRTGRVVVLDFDKCAQGDPALDLGNLLAQLRRLTLRKPGKLPEFASLRRTLLDAYQRWSSSDPGFSERVEWHEQVTLLRKIRFLASDAARHKGAEAMRKRQAEAIRLLKELPVLVP